VAGIQTFDHCGFAVDDIQRSLRFYERTFGGKFLHITNLNTRKGIYQGWPVICFVEMGGKRFELCLAQEPLAEVATGFPRIGFTVTEEMMGQLVRTLEETDTAYEGPLTYPEAVPIKETVRVRDADGNVLEPYGAYLEGDIRADQRRPGEKSVYFYDPFGNRMQLIIWPTPGA
jgi:catechol 2,3-dioxygenase-like lactoylglutathione lyase family enzyme